MVDEDLEEILDLHQKTSESLNQAQKNRKFHIFILILSAILISVLVRVVVGGKSKILAPSSTAQEEIKPEKKLPARYKSFPLKTANFFINDKEGEKRFFVKIEFTLTYQGKEDILDDELTQREHEFADLILTFFSKRFFEDLNTAEKRDEIKSDIKKEFNKIVLRGEIQEVLISEFNILIVD